MLYVHIYKEVYTRRKAKRDRKRALLFNSYLNSGRILMNVQRGGRGGPTGGGGNEAAAAAAGADGSPGDNPADEEEGRLVTMFAMCCYCCYCCFDDASSINTNGNNNNINNNDNQQHMHHQQLPSPSPYHDDHHKCKNLHTNSEKGGGGERAAAAAADTNNIIPLIQITSPTGDELVGSGVVGDESALTIAETPLLDHHQQHKHSTSREAATTATSSSVANGGGGGGGESTVASPASVRKSSLVFSNRSLRKISFKRAYAKNVISTKDLRTAFMLFVVSFLFIVFYLPSITTTYLSLFNTEFAVNLYITHLYIVNSAINPMIYCFLNPNFRNDLVKLFAKHGGRKSFH